MTVTTSKPQKMADTKPFILYCTLPPVGHTTPALQITLHLVMQGYDVSMINIKEWCPIIEAIGAHFIPAVGLLGKLDTFTELFPEFVDAPVDQRLPMTFEAVFVDFLPSAAESLRQGLAHLRQRDPTREIIIIADTCFSGILPLKLSPEAALPFNWGDAEPPRSLGVSVVPAMFTSIDIGPWGSCLPFDPSEDGRKRNKLLASFMHKRAGMTNELVVERQRRALRMCGVGKSTNTLLGDHAELIDHFVGDAAFVCHNTTLQMCIPSLEYPVSDWPKHIKFGGTLPVKPIAPDLTYPSWFPDVLANSAKLEASNVKRKKIVVVAQGTVAIDFDLLVVPTIKALADREDVLVIAVLCIPQANLDDKLANFPDGRIPDNTRVIDYFPYDVVLEHADVFATNSGYGGFQHAVANGIPIVQAGVEMDKPEIGLRAEWAGLGVYLRESPPAPGDVTSAVEKVLAGPYKKKALELQEEAKNFNTLETVERELAALMHTVKVE